MCRYLRRMALLTALVLILAPATQALGWSNGGISGYGTHDWLLTEADALAGVDGAGWLNLSIAQAASDDPDTTLYDIRHHIYDQWGITDGDADIHVASLWEQIKVARNAGDYAEASRLFGLMSHYYSDICNPLHTDQCGDVMHAAYETSVEGMTDVRGESRNLIVPRQLIYLNSADAATVKAATAAHADFATLVSGYSAGGSSAVTDITSRSLSRAANGLADMLQGLEYGYPPAPVVPSTPVTRLGGANRYEVAVHMADELLARRGAPFADVVVACGEDRAIFDPLGAAGLAGGYECPVLLTPTARANTSTLAAIAAMRNANDGRINIHVIGGTGSVSPAAYAQIAALRGKGSCERIDAANRYALAGKMAGRLQTIMAAKGQPVDKLLIVNMENPLALSDALTVTPMSAKSHMPIIGVKYQSVPREASAALALFPSTTRYRVNGSYVGDNVAKWTGCTKIMTRSLYRETAATEIAKYAVKEGLISYSNVGLVNKLSDALPAGALIGQLDGVLLYSAPAPLSTTSSMFAYANRYSTNAGWVFGGNASLSDPTMTELYNALDGRPTPYLASVPCSVSDEWPAGGNISVFVTARDQFGEPIPGATVTSTWEYKSSISKQTAITGSDGVATLTRPVGNADPGWTVYVVSKVSYRGKTRSTQCSFTPQ